MKKKLFYDRETYHLHKHIIYYYIWYTRTIILYLCSIRNTHLSVTNEKEYENNDENILRYMYGKHSFRNTEIITNSMSFKTNNNHFVHKYRYYNMNNTGATGAFCYTTFKDFNILSILLYVNTSS